MDQIVFGRAMKNPAPTPLVQSLPATVPFVGPETQERARGAAFQARLGANESGFGPSPRAIAAMANAAQDVWMYGDPENHDLRYALADHHGIGPDNITVGEGVDGLLGVVIRMFVAPGDAVVTSLGAYPTVNYHVAGFGGVLHSVPYKGDHEDPKALIAKAREVGAKIVYFANPDNPMGSWHSADIIQGMIADLPEGCLLILDEAYGEFAPADSMPPLDMGQPNVIRMRTFSKAYGMAGARVGYGIGNVDLISNFNKIRNHFGVNRIAQAGALAALLDQEYLAQNLANVVAARDEIGRIAQQNGLTPLPSATNFVTMDCGRDGDFARRIVAELAARDVFIRMPFVAPHDRCIRVSAAPQKDLNIWAAALPAALAAAKS